MVGEDFETVSESKKQKVATYASESEKKILFDPCSFKTILNLETSNVVSLKRIDQMQFRVLAMAKLFMPKITP